MNTIEQKREKAQEMKGEKMLRSATTKAININEKAKQADFIISTQSMDRHGDIVMQDSWILKWFEESPQFFWQHESADFPLGGWVKHWFEDDPEFDDSTQMLKGTAEFDTDIYDKADLAFEMVKRGRLNSVSAGFIPHEVEYDEDKDAFILEECELLEASLVGIGSNRRAKLDKENQDSRETAINAKNKLQREIENAEIARIENNRQKKQSALRHLEKSIRMLK